jgi:polyisoprenoid-binding protein YceI
MRAGLSILLVVLGAFLVGAAMHSAAPAASPLAPNALSQAAPVATDSYAVDTVHSSVVFKIKHLGVSYFFGRFNDVSGSFTVDQADAANITFDIKIKAESIDTGNEKRDAHLKSPDFFNARQFPELTFKSTKVEKGSGNTYNVTGDLTMHGVTKPVTAKMDLVGTGSARGASLAGYESTFTVKRSDFGMDFMLEGLGDEVTVMIGLEGKR